MRPATCPSCGVAGREPGKPLTIIGHGFRARSIEGPAKPGTPPLDTEIRCRRYLCTRCGAVLQVVPSGVGRAFRYSLPAIAYALALWGYSGATPEQARGATSTASARSVASPSQWSSLRRWTASALSLFGYDAGSSGTHRERAGRLASWLASKAPLPCTQVPADAFWGALYTS